MASRDLHKCKPTILLPWIFPLFPVVNHDHKWDANRSWSCQVKRHHRTYLYVNFWHCVDSYLCTQFLFFLQSLKTYLVQSFYPEKRNSLRRSWKVQTHCTTTFMPMMSVYKLIMYVETYMEVIILLATRATSLFFMACQGPLKFPDRDQYFTLFCLKHPDDPSSPIKFMMSVVYLPRKPHCPHLRITSPFFCCYIKMYSHTNPCL